MRRTVIVLVATATAPVGVIALLAWVVHTGAITTSAPPPHATPEALEAAYGPQLDRLALLASDEERVRMYQATNDPDDLRLFSPPAILEAKLEENPTVFRMVTARRHEWRSRTQVLASRPRLGRPVANRCWDVLPDRRRVEVIVYHRLVHDRSGKEVSAIVTFDLGRLTDRPEARTPNS